MDELMFDFDDLEAFRIFTEKRMQLLREIMRREVESIRQLAEELDRDVKNVWEDLCLLRRCGLIDFKEMGRRKVPILKKHRIVIIFR